MDMPLVATTVALWSAVAIVGLFVAYCLCCRPKWVHLDYDAALWKDAYAETSAWLREYLAVEIMFLIGAVILFIAINAMQMPQQAWPARIGYALADGVGAIPIGAFLFFVIAYTRAPWLIQRKAQETPLNADVAYSASVENDTVLLRVRNHLATGPFRAQMWLVGGGVFSDQTFSVAWRNAGDGDAREIPKDGQQDLKLLRVERVGPADGSSHVACRLFMFESGAGERELHPSHQSGHGTDVLMLDPIQLHLHIVDPNDTTRSVVVWVHVVILGHAVSISAVMERQY